MIRECTIIRMSKSTIVNNISLLRSLNKNPHSMAIVIDICDNTDYDTHNEFHFIVGKVGQG